MSSLLGHRPYLWITHNVDISEEYLRCLCYPFGDKYMVELIYVERPSTVPYYAER
jgi:hypothetical protein